jgi:hypothetical protein
MLEAVYGRAMNIYLATVLLAGSLALKHVGLVAEMLLVQIPSQLGKKNLSICLCAKHITLIAPVSFSG